MKTSSPGAPPCGKLEIKSTKNWELNIAWGGHPSTIIAARFTFPQHFPQEFEDLHPIEFGDVGF
jgi:hypothetical protein